MFNDDEEVGGLSDQRFQDRNIEDLENLSKETNPLYLSNIKVYYEGFKSLSDEDKAKALLGFFMERYYTEPKEDKSPDPNNLENLNPVSLRERHNLNKEDKLFKLKFYGTVILIGLLITAAITVVILFTYMSLDKGVLDESGTLTGILTILQDVLRIIFMDSAPSSFP